MKKILYAFLFISLAEVTSAQVIGGGLTGSATRMLQVNSSGELTPLAPGTSTQVLFGNGAWGNTPWTINGSNISFTTGNVGIGNANPSFPLDVTGNARVTGTFNSGSTTVNGLTNTANLSVTGTSNFTGAITAGSLTSSDLTVSSLGFSGSNNKMALITPSGAIVAGPLSVGYPWVQGGNANGSLQAIGTIDGFDLPFVAGGNTTTNASIERMRLTANGRLGIGTTQPNAFLHVNTSPVGNPIPGIIVDDQNPSEGVPEFIINSDGSTVINNFQPANNTNNDAFDINTQTGPNQNGDNVITNVFRIASVSGVPHVGIGLAVSTTNDNPINKVSAYKMLTVNGDVSFANNPNGQSDGVNGIEILGNNAKPTRRGISVDGNPDGDFNFYVNSNQANSEFNFVNGANGALSISNPALLTIGSNGQTSINTNSSNTPDAFIINDLVSNSKVANFKIKTTGVVYAREVVVKVGSFPDYVFTPAYNLMPLSQVEKYINANHRLPNMPSATEVEKDGASLGEIQKLSVEKIEELTLYMIELRNQFEKLQKENEDLKKKIEVLESKINK